MSTMSSCTASHSGTRKTWKKELWCRLARRRKTRKVLTTRKQGVHQQSVRMTTMWMNQRWEIKQDTTTNYHPQRVAEVINALIRVWGGHIREGTYHTSLPRTEWAAWSLKVSLESGSTNRRPTRRWMARERRGASYSGASINTMW